MAPQHLHVPFKPRAAGYRMVDGMASFPVTTGGIERRQCAAEPTRYRFGDHVLDRGTLRLLTGGPDADTAGTRERVLATVLFVDLVDSTRHAQDLGDQRWTARLDRFHQRARASVEVHRGRLVNTTGDGIMATFDAPGRAISAAADLRDDIRSMDLMMRAGLHTAEIQHRGTDIAGIGVHIAGRVASAAQADEIWVSRTVTDLVAGTGLSFEPRGEHELRGIDQTWMLFAADL